MKLKTTIKEIYLHVDHDTRIDLSALERGKASSVFDKYPALSGLWDELSEMAVGSIKEYERDEKESGCVYLVSIRGEVVGLIGYWVIEGLNKSVGLRWMGILPEYRGRLIGELLIDGFISFLGAIGYDSLYEIAYRGKTVSKFINAYGFTMVDDEELRNCVLRDSGHKEGDNVGYVLLMDLTQNRGAIREEYSEEIRYLPGYIRYLPGQDVTYTKALAKQGEIKFTARITEDN